MKLLYYVQQQKDRNTYIHTNMHAYNTPYTYMSMQIESKFSTQTRIQLIAGMHHRSHGKCSGLKDKTREDELHRLFPCGSPITE
jgi:hypothetical protein